MSCPKLKFKHMGYQAATTCFHPALDVMLLIPNLLKKDLASPAPAEAGLAVDCLANCVTPELAATLVADVHALLGCPRPYVRRKAALALYKCFLCYPESLRPSFARLTERLEDDDPGVVSAVVSVLCELATHNPRTYLPLAPTFYRLLTSSSNNWMTIKLVKVFGALAPLEPRLGRKLAEPLAHIMATTGAKSVLYECIRAVVGGMTQQPGLVQLCVEKLADFVGETDPNLRFLGLQALQGLLAEHPKAVAYHRATIFECLEAGDPSIQLAALTLVTGLVTRRSLMETVVRLMEHMRRAEGTLRDELVAAVLHMCSRERYALLTDFAWYVAVLAELARVRGTKHGAEVGRQIIDVAVRVDAVQPDAVRLLRPLLLDPALAEERADNASVAEALRAAAWVTGEFAGYCAEPAEALEALLQPATASLPARTQQVYVTAVLKVLLSAAAPRAPNAAPRPPPQPAAPAAAPATSAGENGSDAPDADADAMVAEFGADAPDDENAPGAAAAAAAKAKADAAAAADAAEEAAADAAARAAAAEAEAAWQPPPPRPASSDEELSALRALVSAHIGPLARSVHLEVRERACEVRAILRAVDAAEGAGGLSAARAFLVSMQALVAAELLPVSAKAQRRVVPPAGLDLGAPMPWDVERAEKKAKRLEAAAAVRAAAAAEEAGGGGGSRREALLAAASGGKRRSKRRDQAAADEAAAEAAELFSADSASDSDGSDDAAARRASGGLLLKRKSRAERERDNEAARQQAAAHRERNALFYIGRGPGAGNEDDPPLHELAAAAAAAASSGDVEAFNLSAPSGRALPAWAAPSAARSAKGPRAAVRGGGDEDDEDDDADAARRGRAGGAAYDPAQSVARQHAGLEGVDLLAPLDGEALPTVAAYPRAAPAAYGGSAWAQHTMGGGMGPGGGMGGAYPPNAGAMGLPPGYGEAPEGAREARKSRKEHKEGKERRHKSEREDGGEKKERRHKSERHKGEGAEGDAAALAGDKERRKALLQAAKEKRSARDAPADDA
jgi:AP-3 complex subunit delta-1